MYLQIYLSSSADIMNAQSAHFNGVRRKLQCVCYLLQIASMCQTFSCCLAPMVAQSYAVAMLFPEQQFLALPRRSQLARSCAR